MIFNWFCYCFLRVSACVCVCLRVSACVCVCLLLFVSMCLCSYIDSISGYSTWFVTISSLNWEYCFNEI
jgi:beta-lactamase regulating signal transducer with metallopeptidase domain